MKKPKTINEMKEDLRYSVGETGFFSDSVMIDSEMMRKEGMKWIIWHRQRAGMKSEQTEQFIKYLFNITEEGIQELKDILENEDT